MVATLSSIHVQVHDNLQVSSAKNKEAVDRHRREVHFSVGDYVWDVLTKEHFPPREYNKLRLERLVLWRF